MNWVRFALPAVLALTTSAPVAFTQQVTPDAPSIWREPAGVLDAATSFSNPLPFFTRPHMPAWRTTSDGRIGIRVEQPQVSGPDQYLRFGLMMPELLSDPLLTNTVDLNNWFDATMYDANLVEGYVSTTPGAAMIDWDGHVDWKTTHACLWDDGEITSVGGKDHYQIKVVVTSRDGTNPHPNEIPGIRLCITPVEVIVANPKTPNAYIESVTKTGNQKLSQIWTGPTQGNPTVPHAFDGFGFEPAVAFGGKLFVVRVSSSDYSWTNPETGQVFDTYQPLDVVYAWSEDALDMTKTACWDEVLPIAFAPYDSRINTQVGFALEPFRDTKGNLIVDFSASPVAHDCGATYPWVDRRGDNLFLETVKDTLAKLNSSFQPELFKSSATEGRYPYEEIQIPGFTYDPLIIEGIENQGRHQGISVIGKWTHGKLVQLDNLNNDMDYAIGSDGKSNPATNTLGPQRRLVTLYNPNTVPSTTTIPPLITSFLGKPQEGKLVFSYGRSTTTMPLGENDNANIIDSIENKLNYRKHALTTAYRDIVWHVNNSKQTDQHVFDDSLDPDVLIVANMTGALTYTQPTFTGGAPDYHPFFEHETGWEQFPGAFIGVPEVHNGATALASRWTIPTHGKVLGGGRIEPAANGGVYGKGFWMDGSIGLEFTIPTQTGSESLSGKEWYLGLFLDARFADDTNERRLLKFPDGAEVRLYGRRQVLLVDSGGVVEHRATIPASLGTGAAKSDLLPEGGWAHLALQLRDGGRDVEILLNGLPLSRWRSNHDPLFDITVGDFIVGADTGQSDGFRGWIDEFKLIAHTVDPETACNHAGGTLIGLTSNYSGEWGTEFADRFPEWSHTQITNVVEGRGEESFDAYANFYDYRNDYGNDPGTLESLLLGNSEVGHLRDSVHFPEGPLFHDAPRPFSGDNRFCLSCHHPAGESGLTLGALSYAATVLAADDPRRQPSQPPAKIYGNIPIGLVDITGEPTMATSLPAGGASIDEWMMPDWPGQAVVENFTLLDAATLEELLVLDSFGVGASPTPVLLDPALLGTTDLLVRINLDSAQRRLTGQLMSQLGGIGQLGPRVNLNAPYHFPLNLNSLPPTFTHTVNATPLNGTTRKMVFVIPQPSAAARVVADYQADFQEGSPGAGWLYGWNAGGAVNQVTSFRAMNWNPTVPASLRYSDSGLTFPEPTGELVWGNLHATGGHPGRGTSQGAGQDRFALVGYRVKFAGEYSVQANINVPNPSGTGTGVEVGVWSQSGTTMTALQAPAGTLAMTHGVGPLPSVSLLPGDVLWLGVGPGGSDIGDGFNLTLQVWHDESPF